MGILNVGKVRSHTKQKKQTKVQKLIHHFRQSAKSKRSNSIHNYGGPNNDRTFRTVRWTGRKFHVHADSRKTRLLRRTKAGPSGMSNYDHRIALTVDFS